MKTTDELIQILQERDELTALHQACLHHLKTMADRYDPEYDATCDEGLTFHCGNEGDAYEFGSRDMEHGLNRQAYRLLSNLVGEV